MKLQETMQNTQHDIDMEIAEEFGEHHFSYSVDTPMIEGAFDIDDEEKKNHFLSFFRNHENLRARS